MLPQSSDFLKNILISLKNCKGQEHGAVTNHGKNDTATATFIQRSRAPPARLRWINVAFLRLFCVQHVPDHYNFTEKHTPSPQSPIPNPQYPIPNLQSPILIFNLQWGFSPDINPREHP